MKTCLILPLACALLLSLVGCVTPEPRAIEPPTVAVPAMTSTAPLASPTPTAGVAAPSPREGVALADVVSVEVAGDAGAYRFRVAVQSPDTGCDQYADWWEVITEEGELIYRRVLLHSHPSEQPFERSGSPVPVSADTVVYVRAHMHPTGYGGMAFKGSVRAGLEPVELGPDFAPDLDKEPPLPGGCAF